MVKLHNIVLSLLAASGFVAPTIAHPGESHSHEDIRAEIAKRDAHAKHIARGLANCAGKAQYERLRERSSEGLAEKAYALREERGIPNHMPYSRTRRSLAALKTWEAKNHNRTSQGFTTSTRPRRLFASYKNTSCVLVPEVTQGPYWVTGEYFRKNVTSGQKGVPVHIEYLFVDTNTCDAVPDLAVEIWHTNSSGVYSGVVANGNGDGTADSGNLDQNFLRGLQRTNAVGVASFDTIFPGHYQGRTTHVHMLVHQNGTILSNDTYSGGVISHVGQVFFPEGLKDDVEALAPYKYNKQAITTNDEDMIAQSEATTTYDPFPSFAYLGSKISDGLLMWIAVGIDMSAEYTVQAAATWTADGGVANSGGSGPPSPP